MSSKADNTVYVVRAAGGDVEVFTSMTDAREYARCKRGATILERAVRRSIGEASVVYERRLHIVGGDVRADTRNEELFFAVGDESGIPSADVESFEAKDASGTGSCTTASGYKARTSSASAPSARGW